MNNTRKTMYLLLPALALATGMQAQSSLYVKTKDGTQTAYTVSGIRKLTFPTGNVAVTNTSGNTQSYALSNVRYLSFTDYKTEAPIVKTQDEGSLRLYPNPASNELSVAYQALKSGTVHLRIVDLTGKTLVEQQHENTSGENAVKLNISALPAGVYLLSNGEESKEFVKK